MELLLLLFSVQPLSAPSVVSAELLVLLLGAADTVDTKDRSTREHVAEVTSGKRDADKTDDVVVEAGSDTLTLRATVPADATTVGALISLMGSILTPGGSVSGGTGEPQALPPTDKAVKPRETPIDGEQLMVDAGGTAPVIAAVPAGCETRQNSPLITDVEEEDELFSIHVAGSPPILSTLLETAIESATGVSTRVQTSLPALAAVVVVVVVVSVEIVVASHSTEATTPEN